MIHSLARNTLPTDCMIQAFNLDHVNTKTSGFAPSYQNPGFLEPDSARFSFDESLNRLLDPIKVQLLSSQY